MIIQDNHIHTSYSDGKNTLEEMIQSSIKLGFSKITFTDHVRADSDWVWEYVNEIEKLRRRYTSIKISIGVESKVIDHKGNIDCQRDVLLDKRIEKTAAIHRIPIGTGRYISRNEIKKDIVYSYNNYILALKGIRKNVYVSRIAHPFSLFDEFKDCEELVDWLKIKDILLKSGKNIEYNAKYNDSMVPSWLWQELKEKIVVGSDSHSIQNLIDRKMKLETFINEYMEDNVDGIIV